MRIATSSGQPVLQQQLRPTPVLTTAVLQNHPTSRVPSSVAQTLLQSHSGSITTVKSTPIITNATILQPPLTKTVPNSGGSLLLPNQSSIKTVPVLQTSTPRTLSTTSYQAQPVTLTFLNPTALTDSGPLLTNLLLKPANRINVEIDTSGNASTETVQYLVHGGRLPNVYLPQTGFQIPISGKYLILHFMLVYYNNMFLGL